MSGLSGVSHSLTTNRLPNGVPPGPNNRAWMVFLTMLLSALLVSGLAQTAITRPSGPIAPSTSLAEVLLIGSLSSATLWDQRTVPFALSTVTHGPLPPLPGATHT